MPDREVNAGVLHLSDVDNRRSGNAGCGRESRVEEQVAGRALVHVDDDVEQAVKEHHVGADVGGLVLLPFQIGIPQRSLPESSDNGAVRS